MLKNVLFSRFVKRQTPESARKKAAKICRGITLFFALGLAAVFVMLCTQKTVNVTILFFALFLAVGAFSKEQDRRYVKIEFSQKQALSRGMIVKRVAILSTATLKKAISFLCEGEYLVLAVYDENERFLGELTQNRLSELILEKDIYTPIANVL